MIINLDHPKLSCETTVRDAVTEVAAMVGENVKLRRGFMFSTDGHGVVSSYLHNCPQPGAPTILFQFLKFYPYFGYHSSDFPLPLAIFYYLKNMNSGFLLIREHVCHLLIFITILSFVDNWTSYCVFYYLSLSIYCVCTL
jgi:hypothetical protein